MLASNGTCVTAGSRLRMYGGVGGSSECRYELILCTKVDFPAPAMPIVIMATGFRLGADVDASMTNSMKVLFQLKCQKFSDVHVTREVSPGPGPGPTTGTLWQVSTEIFNCDNRALSDHVVISVSVSSSNYYSVNGWKLPLEQRLTLVSITSF